MTLSNLVKNKRNTIRCDSYLRYILPYKQRKAQAYRQEEITEEIEVIFLNAENLCLMVKQRRE